MIQRMAIAIHREQPDKKEGGEAFDDEDPFTLGDDEEFLPPMEEKGNHLQQAEAGARSSWTGMDCL
jgi:hypothetical protein